MTKGTAAIAHVRTPGMAHQIMRGLNAALNQGRQLGMTLLLGQLQGGGTVLRSSSQAAGWDLGHDDAISGRLGHTGSDPHGAHWHLNKPMWHSHVKVPGKR